MLTGETSAEGSARPSEISNSDSFLFGILGVLWSKWSLHACRKRVDELRFTKLLSDNHQLPRKATFFNLVGSRHQETWLVTALLITLSPTVNAQVILSEYAWGNINGPLGTWFRSESEACDEYKSTLPTSTYGYCGTVTSTYSVAGCGPSTPAATGGVQYTSGSITINAQNSGSIWDYPNGCVPVAPSGQFSDKVLWVKGLRIGDRVFDKYRESCPATNLAYGNPIYPLTGVKRQEVDLGIAVGGQSLKLSYDNRGKIPEATGLQKLLVASPASFGPMWQSNMHKSLVLQSSGGPGAAYSSVLMQRGANVQASAGVAGFDTCTVGSGGGGAAYVATVEPSLRLNYAGTSGQLFDARTLSAEEYNASGALTTLTSASGIVLSYTYSDSTTSTAVAPTAGLLIRITDTFGRVVNFAYEQPADLTLAPRIVTVTSTAGEVIRADYDTVGNLSRLTWADGRIRTFVYERIDLPWALTGIVDENNARHSIYGYDGEGRAISTELAGGVNRYTVQYATGGAPRWSVTELELPGVLCREHRWMAPVGTVLMLPTGGFTDLGANITQGMIGLTSRSQPAGSGCAASSVAQAYDSNGNVSQFDDVNGNRTCYAYQGDRNLRTITLEGLSTTDACPTDISAYVPNTADASKPERKISVAWHPDWEIQTRRAEPGKLTTSIYNGQPDPFNGGAIANCAPSSAVLPGGKRIAVLCKKVEQATTDGTGASGLNVAGVPGQSGDSNIANVSLLLHAEGPNGSNAFPDSSSGQRSPVEIAPAVQVDTSTSRFGSSSGNFIGGFLRYAPSTAWDMGAGDFTVEMWAKFNTGSVGARAYLIGQEASNGGLPTFGIGKGTDNRLRMQLTTDGTSANGIVGSTTVAANTWYHLALVRSGNTLKLYKNGIVDATASVSGSVPVRTTRLGLGVAGDYTGSYGGTYGTRMMGWLDDVRITKGVARYTSAFTPPTEAFGDSTSGTPGVPSQIDTSVSARTWTYTYNQNGQVLSEDGPRTDVADVTTYEYYPDTTSDHTLGDLFKVTNAAGKVTTYTKYNKNGQVLESTDANSVLTVNQYDLRQRLTSVSVGGQTTAYTYDPVGQLTRITRPDASWIGFEYDDAHRQTAVRDNLGNRIQYTLDNAGNRIAEEAKDPGGTLRRSLSRSIDALGRVQQVTGRE